MGVAKNICAVVWYFEDRCDSFYLFQFYRKNAEERCVWEFVFVCEIGMKIEILVKRQTFPHMNIFESELTIGGNGKLLKLNKYNYEKILEIIKIRKQKIAGKSVCSK